MKKRQTSALLTLLREHKRNPSSGTLSKLIDEAFRFEPEERPTEVESKTKPGRKLALEPDPVEEPPRQGKS